MTTHEEDWHQTGDVAHDQGRGDPFAAAVRSTRMPMIVSNPRRRDNPIVFVNDAFLTLTGYDRDEILGRNCRFLQGVDTDRESVDRIRDAVAREEPIQVDLLNYRKDGTPFWNALFVGPVHDDDGEVQFFFASQIDVTERVKAQQAVIRQNAIVEAQVRDRTRELEKALKVKEQALEEKTILLHEVDHRVKNNLTMIGSLLRLQMSAIEDTGLARTLEKMLERIGALATVHKTLHDSSDIRRFDLGTFARGLTGDVISASGRDDIEVIDRIEEVDVDPVQATALGLVLNELLTNTVKHGFTDGRSGRLGIELRPDEKEVVIEISDDGPGFDATAIPRDTLGRKLVERLSHQLGGTTKWTSSSEGTTSITRILSDPA